jgi:Domain of unknown function (DUF4145)
MTIIVHKCPHCLVNDIALAVVSWSQVWKGGHAVHGEVVAHLACPRCSMPSGAHLKAKGTNIANVQNIGGDPTTAGWDIRGFWPESLKPAVPEFLPPDVERIYLQAERNFTMEGNEEASGTMYRKALDVGLKKIDPTLTGTLGAKLKRLAQQGKLTAEISEWADHVRALGNDAAHEEDAISRNDLNDLRNITEMVLRYLFTLPNMIKKRRGEKLPWEPAT